MFSRTESPPLEKDCFLHPIPPAFAAVWSLVTKGSMASCSVAPDLWFSFLSVVWDSEIPYCPKNGIEQQCFGDHRSICVSRASLGPNKVVAFKFKNQVGDWLGPCNSPVPHYVKSKGPFRAHRETESNQWEWQTHPRSLGMRVVICR